MVDPKERDFATPYNDREARYLKDVDFESRMRFIEAAADNFAMAGMFYDEQQKSIKQSRHRNKAIFYQFIGTFLPTSEDGSDQLITRPTAGCILVADMNDPDPQANSIEIRVPVDNSFTLDNPDDVASLRTKKEVYIKHTATDSEGNRIVRYYFAWSGGFGHYVPISDEPREHDIEFQFFVDNIDRLNLGEFTAPEVLTLHKKLVAYNLWYYSETPLDLGQSKSA